MKDMFKSKFIDLMKKEGLNNYSNYFSAFDSFEEIPLFSRYNNISFLKSLSFNEKNKYLIKNGIDIINYIIGISPQYLREDEMNDYLIGISITDWDLEDYNEINCLTPNIYISRKKRWLLSCLRLTQKNSIEENLIKEYLFSLDINDNGIYVATKNNDKHKRVCIFNNPIF